MLRGYFATFKFDFISILLQDENLLEKLKKS